MEMSNQVLCFNMYDKKKKKGSKSYNLVGWYITHRYCFLIVD